MSVFNTAANGHITIQTNDLASADLSRSDLDYQIADRGHTIGRISAYYSSSASGGTGGLWFSTRLHGVLTKRVAIDPAGNVGIATLNPTEKLSVNGTVLAKKVRVSQNAADWPDYVFDSSYQLPSLDSVAQFIQENKHLPEIPSASVIEKEGQDLGEMQKLLLKKMEKMTLYMINQDKKIKELKAENEAIQLQNETIKQELKNLQEYTGITNSSTAHLPRSGENQY